MPTRFDSDMTQLKKRLLAMGAVAEEMIHHTITVLTERNEGLIADVRAAEQKMDAFQRELDDETIRLIAVYTPVATDLRMLLMVTRINAELERIGDQAENICKTCRHLLNEPPLKPFADLPRMAQQAQAMVRNAITAFVDHSDELAEQVVTMDESVDSLYDQLFRELVTHMLDDPGNVSRSLGLIFVAKAFERIGDHAVNIAEDVVYVVRGEDIRHVDSSS
jgi:phosphate transport system protein